MTPQDYDKIKTSIRYWLLGNGYYQACRAMEMGLTHHIGFRKDGKTPEFMHQLQQVNFARTLIDNMLYPEKTLITIFLHDIIEDCNVSKESIYTEFDADVAETVELMTNKVGEVKKQKESYNGVMHNNPIVSIAKGIDRIHNHQSMQGVFDKEKQLDYIEETRIYVLPMLKLARRLYPEQEPVYQNIKSVLLMQMDLIGVINGGK